MKKLVCIIFLILSLSLVGCRSNEPVKTDTDEIQSLLDSEETVVWRVGHSFKEDEPMGVYVTKFAEEIEKAFQGKVEIQMFPSGQLGSSTDIIELIQNDALDVALFAAPYVGPIIPEIQVTDINFVFSSDSDVNTKVLHEGKAIAELNKMLVKNDMIPIDWIQEGFNCWSSNDPIRTPADMKGLKMRSLPSPIKIAGYEVLGSNPTTISFSELYSALQLNMVSGQDNPLSTIEKQKFYEVQDYVTLSYHSCIPEILAMSPGLWNSLSKEDQEIVLGVMPTANAYALEAQDKIEMDSLEIIRQSGTVEIIELSDEQRQEFVIESNSIKDVYLAEGGDRAEEILNLFLEDFKNFSSK